MKLLGVLPIPELWFQSESESNHTKSRTAIAWSEWQSRVTEAIHCCCPASTLVFESTSSSHFVYSTSLLSSRFVDTTDTLLPLRVIDLSVIQRFI